MKPEGNIFDLKRFAIHDGPGIRTTVFFRGCPLDCWWCHNPEGMRAGAARSGASYRRNAYDRSLPPEDNVVGPAVSVEVLLGEIEKDAVFYERSGGGMTASGGEPLMQADFLVEILTACRSAGIGTAVDTCGCAPTELFDRLRGLVDLYLYDVKLVDDRLHNHYTGASNDVILENLRLLDEAHENLWLRVPLIPGITDTDENLEAIARLAESLRHIRRLNLLPYNKIGEDKFERLGIDYRPGKKAMQGDTRLRGIAKRFTGGGFDVRIGG